MFNIYFNGYSAGQLPKEYFTALAANDNTSVTAQAVINKWLYNQLNSQKWVTMCEDLGLTEDHTTDVIGRYHMCHNFTDELQSVYLHGMYGVLGITFEEATEIPSVFVYVDGNCVGEFPVARLEPLFEEPFSRPAWIYLNNWIHGKIKAIDGLSELIEKNYGIELFSALDFVGAIQKGFDSHKHLVQGTLGKLEIEICTFEFISKDYI